MPPATLYHVPKTISSPIVQTLLELDDGPSVHIETLTFKQLKSTEYLKINPMGTSPALTDGSHVLQGPITMFESGAILSWILEEYDTKHKLHPGQ